MKVVISVFVVLVFVVFLLAACAVRDRSGSDGLRVLLADLLGAGPTGREGGSCSHRPGGAGLARIWALSPIRRRWWIVRTTLESRRRAAVAAAVDAAAAKVRDQQARRVLAEVYTHEEDVAALEAARRRQMERIEARYSGLIAEQEARRNESLLRLRQLGRSPQRIAEMTGLSLREITRRLALARQVLTHPDRAVSEQAAQLLQREPVQEPDLSTGSGADAGTAMAVIKEGEADDPLGVEHVAPDAGRSGGQVPTGQQNASVPGQDTPAEALPLSEDTKNAPDPVLAASNAEIARTVTSQPAGPAGGAAETARTSMASDIGGDEDAEVRDVQGAREPVARPRARRASGRAASPAAMDEPLF